MITDEDWQQPHSQSSCLVGYIPDVPARISPTGRGPTQTMPSRHTLAWMKCLVFWSRTSARRRLSASAARPKRSAGDTTGASLRGSRGDQPGKVRRGRILGKLARPSLAGSRGRSGMRLMVGTSFCTAHGLGCSDLQPFVSSQPLRTLIA